MLEINCNICTNIDRENDRCRLYGSDPEIAVSRCAKAEFKGYWYKPYICDGEKDVDKAVAMLRAREKVIRELVKHIEEEQNG